jgi:hypothetical protein
MLDEPHSDKSWLCSRALNVAAIPADASVWVLRVAEANNYMQNVQP